MTRYYMAISNMCGSPYVESIESDDGGWVLYVDVESGIERLRAALAAAEAERERLREALATLRERGCKYETADRPAPDDCECAGCIARAALAGPAATRGGEGT